MQLIDIYLDPSKVFTALRERPTFLVPMAVMVAVTVGMTLAYFLRVDPAWYADFFLTMAGNEMTTAEMAQAKQFMPAAATQGYIAAGAVLIVIPLVYVIYAVYYLLAGKIAGAAVTFKHGLALSAWGSLPGALGIIVGLVGALVMAPQTPQHSLMLTHVDPLLVQLPFDHALSSFAKGFDLLVFWSVGLGALGWKIFTRSSWTTAIVVAALPSVLIFGIWLLIALL